jgi:hypothetical protein
MKETQLCAVRGAQRRTTNDAFINLHVSSVTVSVGLTVHSRKIPRLEMSIQPTLCKQCHSNMF